MMEWARREREAGRVAKLPTQIAHKYQQDKDNGDLGRIRRVAADDFAFFRTIWTETLKEIREDPAKKEEIGARFARQYDMSGVDPGKADERHFKADECHFKADERHFKADERHYNAVFQVSLPK